MDDCTVDWTSVGWTAAAEAGFGFWRTVPDPLYETRTFGIISGVDFCSGTPRLELTIRLVVVVVVVEVETLTDALLPRAAEPLVPDVFFKVTGGGGSNNAFLGACSNISMASVARSRTVMSSNRTSMVVIFAAAVGVSVKSV